MHASSDLCLRGTSLNRQPRTAGQTTSSDPVNMPASSPVLDSQDPPNPQNSDDERLLDSSIPQMDQVRRGAIFSDSRAEDPHPKSPTFHAPTDSNPFSNSHNSASTTQTIPQTLALEANNRIFAARPPTPESDSRIHPKNRKARYVPTDTPSLNNSAGCTLHFIRWTCLSVLYEITVDVNAKNPRHETNLDLEQSEDLGNPRNRAIPKLPNVSGS